MKEARYSIKDLEKLTSIRAHTLRIWEKRYGILKPSRTDTNIRYYCDSELRKLMNLALLNKHGFKISLLSKMTEEELGNKVRAMTMSEPGEDVQIESLISAMIEFDEQRFNKVLNNAIMNYGFEEILIRLVRPLFEKVGILWQTNAINTAQEHFLSNLIRQKIIVATEGILPQSIPEPKTFFLFLREGEWHELSLLILAYLVKKSGHRLVYLGQSTPLDSLKDAVLSQEPDYLLTSLTSSLHEIRPDSYLQQLALTFPGMNIWVTGTEFSGPGSVLPASVIRFDSLNSLRQALAELS